MFARDGVIEKVDVEIMEGSEFRKATKLAAILRGLGELLEEDDL